MAPMKIQDKQSVHSNHEAAIFVSYPRGIIGIHICLRNQPHPSIQIFLKKGHQNDILILLFIFSTAHEQYIYTLMF